MNLIGNINAIPFRRFRGGSGATPPFPSIPGMIARYSALGLTNEQMATNPVWVDKTGNGHDLQMKNLAWGGMSGVGGYVEDFSSKRWIKPADRADTAFTDYSFNITSVKNRGPQFYYQSDRSQQPFTVPSNTVIVKGLTDGQTLGYVHRDSEGLHVFEIEKDGICILPSFEFAAAGNYYGFRLNKIQESCNITIEQLPLYPGALIFDGVDDYGTCDNFPILTKEKGYTVVALRQWLSFQDIGYPTLVVNSTDRLAAFSFEDFRNKTKSTWNWGRSVGLSDYKIPLLYTYQTSTSYNSKTIYAGATEEGSNILQVCRSGFYCANAAIWEIVILDHDATEEELTKIKDYFVKTYPWLFPDQAWTVTGKTNEDEDRATIANITGNGNDLVLSNFGFAEGSGYGSYFWNFKNFQDWNTVTEVTNSKIVLKGSASNFWGSQIVKTVGEELHIVSKVKVTGLTDEMPKLYFGKFDTGDKLQLTNGINNINKIIFAQYGWYGFGFEEAFESCNITIEQIPEYEGYLVTDGVDDTGRAVGLTISKDFTLVGEWILFSKTSVNAGLSIHPQIHIFNQPEAIKIVFRTAGKTLPVKSLKAICSDGRCYDENWSELKINVGEFTDNKGTLFVASKGTNYAQIAFKNLGIYDNHILSKDDCIKAYNYLQTLKAK